MKAVIMTACLALWIHPKIEGMTPAIITPLGIHPPEESFSCVTVDVAIFMTSWIVTNVDRRFRPFEVKRPSQHNGVKLPEEREVLNTLIRMENTTTSETLDTTYSFTVDQSLSKTFQSLCRIHGLR